MFTNEQIASFSDLEVELYEYITSNAEKVVFMRIRDLAEATHVSPTTILRFCRKLDCDGFSEFKVQLKLYLKQKSPSLLSNTQQSLQEFVERIVKIDYQENICSTAKEIAKAQTVIFVGVGSSGILAEYGSRYFSGLKRFSLYIKDPFFPIHGDYLKNSISIVLSVSGETPTTLSQVNRLKEKGSRIVSITNSQSCTLARISDHNLTYYVTTELIEHANITTQLPVIYLLESLARETYQLLYPEL